MKKQLTSKAWLDDKLNKEQALEKPTRSLEEVIESLRINGWTQAHGSIFISKNRQLVKVVFWNGATAEGRFE